MNQPTTLTLRASTGWNNTCKTSLVMVIAVTPIVALDKAGWIIELDRGEGIPWQGNPSWLEQKPNVWKWKKNRVQASQNPERELE